MAGMKQSQGVQTQHRSILGEPCRFSRSDIAAFFGGQPEGLQTSDEVELARCSEKLYDGESSRTKLLESAVSWSESAGMHHAVGAKTCIEN